MATETIGPEQSAERFAEALTLLYGESSKYGGYEVWADNADGAEERKSLTVEHRYGSRDFTMLMYDEQGEIALRWTVTAAAGEFAGIDKV